MPARILVIIISAVLSIPSAWKTAGLAANLYKPVPVKTDGKVDNVEKLGSRKLAYPIKKATEAYYLNYHFEANPEFISELERNYRITDDVYKFLTIREED